MRKLDTVSKKIIITIIGLTALGLSTIGGLYAAAFLLGPPSLVNDENTLYYSRDGEVLGEERGMESRYRIELSEIDPTFIKATLAAEDRRFYDHNGFDIKRILSAALSDVQTLSLKEGASTLTQQYARNLYLSHDKSWIRKIKEAFYTIRLEMFYTKDEILEGYLNTIYYGHGAYGIEAASRYFFAKSAEQLSLAESSILAAIPKGPAYYSPYNERDNAKRRQKHILQLMQEDGEISAQEAFLAYREPLAFVEREDAPKKTVAPYFQDTALQEAAHILQTDKETLRSGGYKIYTTLDKTLQKRLDKHIQKAIDTENDLQAGALSIEPETGAVLAMYGGHDYQASEFNRAIQAKRMPGSAFKPFLYYAALEHGYDATTQLMSKPTSFKLENGDVYEPSNFNDYYAEKPITLAQAIALSDNIYAVKTNLYLEPKTLPATAKRFGIDRDLPEVPSLALGTAEVTVEEMVTGYGMLANNGHNIQAHTVEKIVDRDGHTVYKRKQHDQKNDTNLDPKKTFMLTQLMTGMFDRELDGYMAVTGASIADQLTRNYAGKSGTTDTDSWMIGYSPDIVTGIWTGYDDSRPMERVVETAYAKNIWADFMEDAHDGKPPKEFTAPAGVVGLPIDPETGKRATSYCDKSRIMYFEKGAEPQLYCRDHLPKHDDNEWKTDNEKGLFEKWFELFFGFGS